MRVVVWILLSCVVALSVVWAIAGATTLPTVPPSPLHRWLPLPITCVGSSCVTYHELSVRSSAETGMPSMLLTSLLEARAWNLAALEEGVRVSEQEIDQALGALRERLTEHGGERLLQDLYAQNEETLREGLRTLLLREKLQALGITSPWREDASVSVWNMHLRWDPSTHQIVSR